MKKTARIAILILLVSLLTACFGIFAFADTGYQESNALYAQSKVELLRARRYEHYFTKLDEDGDNIEGRTCEVILGYSNAIEALLVGDRAQSLDLTADIDLLYSKGMSSGILAWIYFYHTDGQASDAISQVYEAQKQQIDGKTANELDFFKGAEGKRPEVEKCYTRLLHSIYTEKIKALGSEADSEDVSTIIKAALLRLGSDCSYDESESGGGEDAKNYVAFYENLRKGVSEQRNRDKTKSELRYAFERIMPNVDFESFSGLAPFFDALKTAKKPVEMNELLLEALEELLKGVKTDGAIYRTEFIESKLSAVNAVINAENSKSEPVVAAVSHLFEDYTLKLAISDAKDSLCRLAKEQGKNYSADRLSQLQNIVSEYNGDGKIFDSAKTREALATEQSRAEARCFWLDVYLSSLDGANAYRGDHSAVTDKIKSLYESTDKAICAGSRDGEAEPDSRLSGDIAALTDLVSDAEVIEFYLLFDAIIKKEQIKAEDREALESALTSASELSALSMAKLDAVLTSLGEKYMVSVKDAINATVISDGAESVRRETAQRLFGLVDRLSVKDNGGNFIFKELIASANAIIKKINETKRVLDAYNDEYLSGVRKFFADKAKEAADGRATEIINADEGRETEIADLAIDEILRISALEKLHQSAEEYSDVSGVSELLERAADGIGAYCGRTSINSYLEERLAELDSLILANEKRVSKQTLSDYSKNLGAEISTYKFISDEQKATFLSKLELALVAETGKIDAREDLSSVREAMGVGRGELEKIADEAKSAEIAECLTDSKSKLGAAAGDKADYSEENYKKIEAVYGAYFEKLESGASVSEILAALDEGVTKLGEIEDLLQTAQRVWGEELYKAYNSLMEKRHCYSAENLEQIEGTYRRTLAELSVIGDVSKHTEVEPLVKGRIELMKNINLDKLYTKDGLFGEGSDIMIPEDYDPYYDGYIGAISASNGIPSDLVLKIDGVGKEGIAKKIKTAATRRLISLIDGGSASKDIIKLLKNCHVIEGIEIDLGRQVSAGQKTFKVSLLLPSGVNASDVRGVVFVHENGAVEFLEVTPGTGMIEFATTHFSTFYIIGDRGINLVPWIVCLGIIILCELIAIAILVLRRRKRKVAIYALAMPVLAATRYQPKNGNIVLAIMGAAALALGGIVAYLLYLEYAEKKRQRLVVLQGSSEAKAASESQDAERETEEMSEVAVLTCEQLTEGEIAESDTPSTMPPKMLLGDISTLAEPLASVSADEADLLMSDSEAKELQRSEGDEYEDPEVYSGTKKAEINIDTISEMFGEGETVNLNTLKEKRLLQKNVGYVKVLARGVLDKPLVVVAQDFSVEAAKMIFLTGGRAIVTHRATDRGGRSAR